MGFSPPSGDYAIENSASNQVNIQSVMKLVYMWMGFGLLTTTVVAFLIANNQTLLEFTLNPVFRIVAFIGTFGLVIALSLGMTRNWMTPNLAMLLFFVYSAVMGVLLSVVAVMATTPETAPAVTSAFLSTVVLFGTMSIFGFTTNMDLTKWGTYAFMGLIGLILVMVLNIFLQSSGLAFLISIIGVIIFTVLTAYDTQKIKEMSESYEIQSDGNLAVKMSILGALTLYLDFINLFLFLLQIFMGGRD